MAALLARTQRGGGCFYSSRFISISYSSPSRLLTLEPFSSVPAAAIAAIIIELAMPNGFPYQGKPREQRPNSRRIFSKDVLQRLDILGAALLLIATLFLVATLEEADVDFPWRSAFVILLLVISGFAWVAFSLWERCTTQHATSREPVFPWCFANNRVLVGMLLYVRQDTPCVALIANIIEWIAIGVPFSLAGPGSVPSSNLLRGFRLSTHLLRFKREFV